MTSDLKLANQHRLPLWCHKEACFDQSANTSWICVTKLFDWLLNLIFHVYESEPDHIGFDSQCVKYLLKHQLQFPLAISTPDCTSISKIVHRIVFHNLYTHVVACIKVMELLFIWYLRWRFGTVLQSQLLYTILFYLL